MVTWTWHSIHMELHTYQLISFELSIHPHEHHNYITRPSPWVPQVQILVHLHGNFTLITHSYLCTRLSCLRVFVRLILHWHVHPISIIFWSWPNLKQVILPNARIKLGTSIPTTYMLLLVSSTMWATHPCELVWVGYSPFSP